MYGVGMIGAGPGAEALHLPLVAARDSFRVVHVSDAGSGRAERLAAPLGARSSTGVRALLADSEVDVAVICSPPEEHADHVVAAVASGVAGVFCEKPLSVTETGAHAAIDAARRAGVALTVGGHHRYDGAWERAQHHLIGLRDAVRFVSVTASLPPNDRYHAVVSDPEPGSGAGRGGLPDLSRPPVASAVVRRLIHGLLVHDLPVLRDLVPRVDEVVYARAIAPIGLTIGLRGGDATMQLTAVLQPEGADAMWRMTIATDADVVEVDHPPAFVDAGSARVTVRHADRCETIYPQSPHSGYHRQWDAFEASLSGAAPTEYDELLADALYALDIADRAAGSMGGA